MIPYLLAAIGGYFIGESQKKESGMTETPQMAKGGMMASGGEMMNKKKLFLTIADMMRDYFGFIKIKFAGGESDYDFENKDFYKFSEGDFDAIRIKKGTNTLILQMSDDNHITFNGQKLSVKDLFDKGDKYFFVKDDELLTFELNGDGMSWYNNTDEFPVIVSSGLDASHFLFMFDNKSDWTNYEPSLVYEDTYAKGGMMAKGGRVKKKWIQDALTGDEGSLRRTAKRKGLLKGDENLSMTDLKKLQKMGGKTSKRAHLAETLRKFDDGGMMDKEVLDMKIKKYEEAYKNPNLTIGAKKSIRMKLNELKAYRKGTHNELSKYGRMEDGGMMGYGGTINFMGEEYPFKTINGYIFAKYDLYDKLMDSDGEYVSKEAEEIDNRITFYLQDEYWDKSDDEIIKIWKEYSR